MPSPNLADILAKISDSLYVLDSTGQVIFANDKASKILAAVEPEFHDRISQALREGVVARFESFHDSLKRWFEHQTHPNSDGGLTVFSRDVTSRRRLEEALRASEERFRRLMDSDIIGMFVVEIGMITEANDVFLRSIGYTRDDLVARKIRLRELTPPEYDSIDACATRQIEANGVFSPYEKEFLRKNGSRLSVLIGGVTTQKEPAETLCLALDLTDRKRAEERMRALVECGKILASSLDCEKTFPEVAEVLVSSFADSCLMFINNRGTLLQIAAAHRAPVNTVAHVDVEDIRRVLLNGKTEASSSPVFRILAPIMARNETAGVLVVISARQRRFDAEDLHLFEVLARRAGLALDNSRLYQEAQTANRLKDEFVAIVSHELRTPLTPILGGVYMLRSEPRDEGIFVRALELIERSAKAQVKIVDDLLDVSRALSGKLRLNIEAVDLTEVVKAAVETIRPASNAKGIQIELQLEPMNGLVCGDADRLQQILWNLLANSVKFTSQNGNILIKLSEHGDYAEIAVKDNGVGIESEFLPHVFDGFRQGDTSRTRVHGGLGLGLAIVRQLVESHGGSVQAHSSGDSRGATFVVKLPMRPAARSASTS
jgi:PAS domain S-box-containing protein